MRRAPSGQATVEFALVLPVVVLVLLLLVQFVIVARTVLLAHEAAREVARAASLDPDPAVATAVGARILPEADIRVTRTAVGAPVRASVRVRVATDVPVVGALLPDPEFQTGAEMRAER